MREKVTGEDQLSFFDFWINVELKIQVFVKFFSIMKPTDQCLLYPCRKAVDVVENRYNYKGLCKKCRCVC